MMAPLQRAEIAARARGDKQHLRGLDHPDAIPLALANDARITGSQVDCEAGDVNRIDSGHAPSSTWRAPANRNVRC
jgi:hypothetical protein